MDERIKELRKALGLTQQDFASRLGTARDNIAGYETGRRRPSDAVISLICKTFGVSDVWLRTGDGVMFVEPDTFSLDQYASERGCTDLEREILKAYFDLDAGIRDKVLTHFIDRLTAAKERMGQAAASAETEARLSAVEARLDAFEKDEEAETQQRRVEKVTSHTQ